MKTCRLIKEKDNLPRRNGGKAKESQFSFGCDGV